MTRTRMALILPAVGLAGVLGLAGCGAAAPTPSDVADEAAALQQVGFDTGLQVAPSPSASTDADSSDAKSKVGNRGNGRKAVRKYLRKNTLHGEVTVQGKDGTKTIVVQRGAITAVSGTSLTVKSTDGYTLTWKLADKATVVQDKKKVETSALKTGEQIGIAGTKDGSADDARLVAIQ
jgi:diaminopimelate epimerase